MGAEYFGLELGSIDDDTPHHNAFLSRLDMPNASPAAPHRVIGAISSTRAAC
jgi:hypothetical protein